MNKFLALFTITSSVLLASCSDENVDITGKYVNVTNNEEYVTLSLSKDKKLIVFKGKKKIQTPYGGEKLFPFFASTYKKDNFFYLEKNNEKVGTINGDEIHLTLKEYDVDNTYKKK